MHDDLIWLIVGFGGQALFSMRFLIQWLTSERRGRSVIPVVFWYFSLWGGITLFVYAGASRTTAGIVGLWWVALTLAVILIRPATVADETRYLSVAWDMHQSG